MRHRIAIAGVALASMASADVALFDAIADNTLYDVTDGSVSNGKGDYFFAGTTLISNAIRRGLIRFDISTIPSDAEITSVRLTLHMSRTVSLGQEVFLHRAAASWGEGESNAPGEEGAGDVAQPGDATWLHQFHATTFWQNVGGDFDATASASKTVSGLGFYSWSGTGMVQDAQTWLADGSSNFGWFVMGVEEIIGNAKRFDSRENADASVRPVLQVEYRVIPAPGVCIFAGAALAGFSRRHRR